MADFSCASMAKNFYASMYKSFRASMVISRMYASMDSKIHASMANLSMRVSVRKISCEYETLFHASMFIISCEFLVAKSMRVSHKV